MKTIWKMATDISGRFNADCVRVFLLLCMIIYGAAGCLAGCALYALGVCPGTLIGAVLVCGGYGAFLVGLLGGELYLLLCGQQARARIFHGKLSTKITTKKRCTATLFTTKK